MRLLIIAIMSLGAMIGVNFFPPNQQQPFSEVAIKPPNMLKGNCPGDSLSLNFFSIFENTTKVKGISVSGEEANRLVEGAKIPHVYKGKPWYVDLPNADTFWLFPTNGEQYPELSDYVFIFGVKNHCVVSGARMPLGLVNELLRASKKDPPKVLPYISPEIPA